MAEPKGIMFYKTREGLRYKTNKSIREDLFGSIKKQYPKVSYDRKPLMVFITTAW